MSDLMQGSGHQTTEGEQPQEQQQQESTLFSYAGRDFTAEDAVKKMENADRFIEEKKQRERELEERLAAMEAELAKSKKLEEALEELKQSKQTQTQGDNTSQPSAGVDAEKLKQQVLAEIKAEQEKATSQAAREANLRKAHETATQALGSNYMDSLVAQAKERQLDLSADDIIDLAARKPSTFTELFQLNKQSKPSAAPMQGNRTPSNSSQQVNNKDWKALAAETAKRLGTEYDSNMHNIPKAQGIRR